MKAVKAKRQKVQKAEIDILHFLLFFCPLPLLIDLTAFSQKSGDSMEGL
jgi:hypothetical protein